MVNGGLLPLRLSVLGVVALHVIGHCPRCGFSNPFSQAQILNDGLPTLRLSAPGVGWSRPVEFSFHGCTSAGCRDKSRLPQCKTGVSAHQRMNLALPVLGRNAPWWASLAGHTPVWLASPTDEEVPELGRGGHASRWSWLLMKLCREVGIPIRFAGWR